MNIPPNSPDMNPIEHLWAVLKKELFRRFPDTLDLPGHPEAVQRLLAERLAIVWTDRVSGISATYAFKVYIVA